MKWKTIFPYSIPYWQFSSIPFDTKIFHSVFHTSIPIQGKFRPEATRNLYCTFATLSAPLQVVAREGKQYGTMPLVPYLKHYRNERPQKFT